jgi:hypothetical protein
LLLPDLEHAVLLRTRLRTCGLNPALTTRSLLRRLRTALHP